jgi:hypothetical protein
MTRAELLALADLAEKAEGEDQELDEEIAEAIGWERRESRWSVCPDWRAPGKTWDQSHADCDEPPAYTASLDAAASLERAEWLVTIEKDEEGVTAFVDRYVGEHWEKTDGTASGEHAEPRARTAAALRARAEEAGNG